ncbi:MAG: EFR1 family ferrodoxin [Endomicrobia bacterium]|nr:EFR1 family ferrodoxin [Endomicrobiia bacterium]
MKNKNVDIYFFSGTGNTYLAAKKIEETFEKNGCSVNLLPIEKADPAKIDLSKTIGLGFTIACWNTYPFVRKFYENLPKAEGTEMFIFTTMGDSSLKTAATAGYILSKKGYSVIATKGFRMPNNFIAVRSDEKNRKTINMAYPKIESFALDILNGVSSAEKTNIFLRFCYMISRFVTNTWNWKINQKIMRLNLKKEKCVKCGLCAKICPVKNISYSEYPAFDGNKCQFCLRCMSYCPPQAIKKFFVLKTYRALNDITAITDKEKE